MEMKEATESLFDIVLSLQGEQAASVVFRGRAGGVVSKTYAECFKDALALAAGFRSLGVKEGDIVAIHGSTSYGWFLTDLACVLNGAVSLALYPSAPISRVLSSVIEMRASLLLTDDVNCFEQLKESDCKVLLLNDEEDSELESVGTLRSRFAGETAWPQVSGSREPFTIVSTSGTLSEPKFFSVHSRSLRFTMDRFKEIYQLSSQDSLLLALPQAHLPQRMLTYGVLKNKMGLILSSPARFLKDSVEFNPTIHVVVPRMLEYIDDRLRKEMASGKSRLIKMSLPALKLSPDLAFRLVGSKIFGKKARYIFVGSAPTPGPVLERLKGLGCPIYEVYGTTELGILAISTPEFNKTGSVGKPVDWGTLKIEPGTNEVIFSTRFPFLHGLVTGGKIVRNDSLDDKFGRTGDIGFIDEDGFLTLSGRIRDFVALISGEKIFVRGIEDLISRIEGVSACTVVGNGMKELSVVLFADPEAKFESPARRSDHFRKALSEINRNLSPMERVKKLLIVDEPPSVENHCLTETLKLRRHVINEKYAKDYQHYQSV